MMLHAGSRPLSKLSVKPGTGVPGASCSGTPSGISWGDSSASVSTDPFAGEAILVLAIFVEIDCFLRPKKYPPPTAKRRRNTIKPALRGALLFPGLIGRKGF